MRILPINSFITKKNILNGTREFVQNNATNITDPIKDNVNFCAGEDIGGIDLLAPENDNPNEPSFKDGMLAVLAVMTFPISFPIITAYESYKDKHANDLKTDIDPDNIEE